MQITQDKNIKHKTNMQITIQWLSLTNFKGIRSLRIDFGKTITNISGGNATGKTTIFDAFTWLLFGKNSDDVKDFNIKTLDANNKPLHKLSHEVEGLLTADGLEIRFRKCYKEKWVKKRGAAEEEFTGHETEYFVDDVPLTQKEYQARVDFILNESVAKMLTNPLYFNSLKWQDRRTILESLIPSITDAAIASENDAFTQLIAEIGGETIINFKKKIASQKNRIKDSLSNIPPRIDELQRSKPTPVDYKAMKVVIQQKEKAILAVEQELEDSSKAYEAEFAKIQKEQQRKNDLQMDLNREEAKILNESKINILKLENKISVLESELEEGNILEASILTSINTLKRQSQNLIDSNDKLRNDWTLINARQLLIDDHALECPTCRQLLPESQKENKISLLTKNFNSDKQNELNRISETGKLNKIEIEKNTVQITELNAKLDAVKHNIEQHQKDLINTKKELSETKEMQIQSSPRIDELKAAIAAIIIPTSPVIDVDGLKQKRNELRNNISELNQQLALEGELQRIEERIKQLSEEEKTMAQELADLERKEYLISEFTKAKIDAIEKQINAKFTLAKFKMFEQQINGGETEICECLMNGVPFSDLNTASKINVGVDIINVLSAHYNVIAPIFIDNRESVNSIIETKSQLINLIVSKENNLKFEQIN